jgi:hypothetical protein
VGLLEDMGLRRPYDSSNRIGGRRPPKDLGELRFEEWLYILGLSPEDEDGSKLAGAALAERQYRAGTGSKRIGGADCQEDQLSPSVQKALKGYVRVGFYADNANGKSDAKKRGKKLSDEYEGELFVRVRRVYCKDSRQWGWSVWVKQTGTREETVSVFGVDQEGKRTVRKETRLASVMAPRKEKAGGFGTGTVRSWTAYRSAAKKKVSCPKCDAPKDFPCVNDRGIEEGIYEENGKPMTAKQAQKYKAGRGLVKEVRVRRTNAHRQRVDKYLKEKEGLVENPLTAQEGDFIKDEERRPPTDRERESWMLRNFNEGQVERFEDLEDEGSVSVEKMETILNKKQRVKYDKWADFGQPIEKEE